MSLCVSEERKGNKKTTPLGFSDRIALLLQGHLSRKGTSGWMCVVYIMR